jgi:prenyltransferase beta subunit
VSAGQTFEGGISAKPDIEAHGAYAFCALACLCILGDPHVIVPKYASLPSRTLEHQMLTRGFPDISMFLG